MKKSNNSSRDNLKTWVDIITDHLCLLSPFGIFLQYQILQDKSNLSGDSRQKENFRSYLSVTKLHTQTETYTKKNTHWGSQRDNWGIVGSRESESIFRQVDKQPVESTQTQTCGSLLFVTVTSISPALSHYHFFLFILSLTLYFLFFFCLYLPTSMASSHNSKLETPNMYLLT